MLECQGKTLYFENNRCIQPANKLMHSIQDICYWLV